MASLVGGRSMKMEHSNLNKVPGDTNQNTTTTTSGLKMGRQSRRRLLEYLSTRNRAPYYRGDVCNLARNHPPFLYRMNFMKNLPVHDGCVNTICWNKTGEYILSGSDDRNLCITKPTYLFDDSKDYSVLHKVQTHHLGNIFSAQFIPNSNDNLLVSCSSEGPVIVHDIKSNNPSQGIFNYNCHSSTIHEVVPLQDDGNVFLSCGEDKTVRLFDMRCHRSCARASTCPHPALIRNSSAMTTLSIHPMNTNLLLIGRADGLGLIYDRRKLPDITKFSREQAHEDYLNGIKDTGAKYLTWVMNGVVSRLSVPDNREGGRFTSLCFSASGDQVLANYSQDYIYLFNLDRSSNFELIQTLPRNPNTSSSSGGGSSSSSSSSSSSGGGSSGNNNNNDDNNDRDRSCIQTGRMNITPRIRVRGDWSDTGINSVPHSVRQSENGPNSQRTTATNFLQRMTELAFNISNRRGSRFIPITEIIRGTTGGQNSGVAESHSVPSVEEQDEGGEDDDDDDNDDEDNDEHDDVDGHDEEEEEVEDEEESQEEAAGGVVDSSTPFVMFRPPGNDHYNLRRNDRVVEENRQESRDKSGGVSAETKLKFRKTFDDLKVKYDAIPNFHPRVRYQGHRNTRTSIKEAIFWGDDYIMSGSDCGRIMIWEKDTAKLVMGFPADERVVNRLAPNPHHYVLASSGIDYDIKLWSTQSVHEAPLMVSKAEMDTIVRNNELMLEEAKQTITVPPHLFFRVLASFADNRLS